MLRSASQVALLVSAACVLFVGANPGVSADPGVGAEKGTANDSVRFNRDIRPILAEHCLNCHGPDENQREADLRLDLEHDARDRVIDASALAESELLRRVLTDDTDLLMPPTETGKSLTEAEKETLQRWVLQGAKYEGHWAYEPIRKPNVPATKQPARTSIDRFIVSKLDEFGLSLSPKVSREQLIRRATFDLTGLPPSWDEVEHFVNDTSPDALERMIDRLLDSPRYGERWGRHWLDLARYADTEGGAAIGFKKFAFSYTYRDYVIRSLNADVPYDRFILEQIAADQLGLDDNAPELAGLGFLTVGMQFRNPHDTIDDQIDVVTRGLMGLTVACARCHDHKYDAIPTTDYYALYATLASSEQPKLPPVIGTPNPNEALAQYTAELQQRQVAYDDMARDQSSIMRGRLRTQVGLYLRELAKGTPEQDLSAAFLSYRTDDIRPLILNRWRDYLADMPASDPVFGLWVALRDVEQSDFQSQLKMLLDEKQKENGDLTKFANQHLLGSNAPKWNPRVIETLLASDAQSLFDVADAYGQLFSQVHQEWLKGQLEAALEAAPSATVVPDQDKRHAAINSAINRQLRRHLYEIGSPTAVPDSVATTLLNRTVRDSINGKNGAIHNLHLSAAGSPPRAMVLVEKQEVTPFRVFRRGNPIDRGEIVEPHFLSVLAGEAADAFPNSNRRLALAKSIADPQNPLTRRVIANWVWQHHFGRGLVRTSDDFGTRGDAPTHPELLDFLATLLLDEQWSLKQLHRHIMLSDVYQQASLETPSTRAIDPDNNLLWRMPRRRLDLEAMRDAMLHVSGELDTQLIGGRPFDFLSSPIVPRRSVYGFVNRDIISSLASTFDQANPNSCTAQRPETTVPQQTLFALNSDFIQDRAIALASLASQISDDQERIGWLYRRVYSRLPSEDEIQSILDFAEATSNDVAQANGDAWQQIAHVLLAANEFVFVD